MKHIIKISRNLLLILMVGFSNAAFCQTETAASKWTEVDKLNSIFFVIALVLLIPFFFFSKFFQAILKGHLTKILSERSTKIVVLLTMVSSSVFGQEAATVAASSPSLVANFNFTTWMLLTAIFVELFALAFLSFKTYQMTKEEEACDAEEETENWLLREWKKMNNFGSLEDEAKIDSGHSYDGIRELDNNIPVWFSASFVICILIAAVYWWRYHVSEVSPLMIEEYQIEVEEARLAQELYNKNSGSKLDEEHITLLDGSDIEEGKKLYLANCASCHVADGGGQTGPNLTDAYWLHSGSPSDIFKSIKYGWSSKGMMAWKDNFNDKQILQLASFVNSLNGTKPANPKPAQGDQYTPAAATTDSSSTTVSADTTKK